MTKSSERCKARKGHYVEAKINTGADGSLNLILPEIPEDELIQLLPPVSIVTITKNRGMFSGLMLYNWINIKYPRDKLEWVILDDSDPDCEYNLADYIPQEDPYINYVKLSEALPVAEKRNKAVEFAKYDFIVHMNDDDYYFPDHVLAKIRIMLQYNSQGVHSFPIGVYDMMNDNSYICDTRKDKNYDTNYVAEATLAYRKEYWEKNKFISDNKVGSGEGGGFINKHFDKWVNLHFMFNTISITHTENITGDNRRLHQDKFKKNEKSGDFKDLMPKAFFDSVLNLKKLLNQVKK